MTAQKRDTVKANPLSFRDEIRETVSPHKFGGSKRAAMLWLLMLDSGQDGETGDANEWHYWVGRFGKRLLYIYPSGAVEAVLCSTEEEAEHLFLNEAHAYGIASDNETGAAGDDAAPVPYPADNPVSRIDGLQAELDAATTQADRDEITARIERLRNGA